MLLTGLLLALLATYVVLRVGLAIVRALELDPWATLVHLGLAELESPSAPRRQRAEPRRPPATRAALRGLN